MCACTCGGKQRALIQTPGLSVGVYYSEDNIDYIIFPHSFLLVLWAFFFFLIVVIFLSFCFSYYFFFNLILFFNFTILYWFCHISKWIHHRYTCVPHPEPSSLLPPHSIPLGRPSAPAPSIQYRASNLDCDSFHIYYTCFNAITFELNLLLLNT